MNTVNIPKISLIAPTMGSFRNIKRMIDSIIYQASEGFLHKIELVFFLNADPDDFVDVSKIKIYIDTKAEKFHSIKFIRADKFYLTAEESACAAVSHGVGEYLWIAGDKRIFLPEGLAQLAAYIEAPTTPCAYFNSVWYGTDGQTDGLVSTYLASAKVEILFKDFVRGNGINFISTAMGSWIFERKFLDIQKWKYIIENCGPHFSHVSTLLETMGTEVVTCHAVFLHLLESKPYHEGNVDEWERYANLAKTYRYYPWTFGMVRQLNHLIKKGVYSFLDIRRMMCCEGLTLNRQVDEIYNHLLLQIWRGWLSNAQRVTRAEFDELMEFMVRVCPERAILNGMMRQLYDVSERQTAANFLIDYRTVRAAIDVDKRSLLLGEPGLRLASLIVSQVGADVIRLHPNGYLRSSITDNSRFLGAYRLLSPPQLTEHWEIIGPDGLSEFVPRQPSHHTRDMTLMMPQVAMTSLGVIRRYPRVLARRMIQSNPAARTLARMPRWVLRVLYKYIS